MPYLTDTPESIEDVVKSVSEVGADYLIVDVLNLRKDARQRIMLFLEKEYPHLVAKYEELYQNRAYAPSRYIKDIFKMGESLRDKYGVNKFERGGFE